MADETLPAEWALDMAAKAAWGQDCAWELHNGVMTGSERKSIIAHARTLEKHAPHLKPIDENLLIAREICAKVTEVTGSYTDPEDYRNGEFDTDTEVQFTLSMLRRDPEALAAFRKENGL